MPVTEKKTAVAPDGDGLPKPRPKHLKPVSAKPPVSWGRRRFIRHWPLFVWIAVILVCAYLYASSSRFGGMVGDVDTNAEPVAPLETARLIEVTVRPGQTITAGTVVARMDTSSIDVEIAVADATLAESQGTIENYQGGILQIVRQFQSEIKDSEMALEEQKLLQQRDQAQMDILKQEQARRDDLRKKQLISEMDASLLRPQIAALEKGIASYPELIKINQRRLEQARAQMADLRKVLRIDENEDIFQAIEKKTQVRNRIFAQEKQMLEIERSSYELKATRAGVVSLIEHVAGDVVEAGEPIVRIVSEKSDTVIGFLPEIHLGEMKRGEEVTVWRRIGRGSPIKGIVESIAPEIDTMPTRISPIQGQLTRGRRVVIRLMDQHTFVPGETVQVRTRGTFLSKVRNWIAGLF